MANLRSTASIARPFRNSNPDTMVVQSGCSWDSDNDTRALGAAEVGY